MLVPLHIKSDYSLGYGTASIEQWVERAAALGYGAVALTDLENLYGQVQFHHLCRRYGIRPVTGVELRPGFDGKKEAGRRSGRIVLLALNDAGYRNLCRIVSRRRGGVRQDSPQESLSDDPVSLISRYGDGLIALSDDPEVLQRLHDEGEFAVERMGLLVIRPGDPAAEAARIVASSRLGIAPVADLDCVFLHRWDHPLHLLQRAIRRGIPLVQAAMGTDAESAERWLRSPGQATALFADLPAAVQKSAEIALRCRLDLTAIERTALTLDVWDREESSRRLRRLCEKAAADMGPSCWSPDHGRRLDSELAVFEDLGFSGFMLIVADILTHCREEGIPVAVRGSAVSSLVLHLLGGSPVDPLGQGLLFERFLHGGKSTWPDVDIDLPWHRRDQVIQWVYRHFGEERVAMVSAHHSFRLRSALREGLKAWGATPSLIEAASRALPPEELGVEEVDFLGLAQALKEPHEAEPLLARYQKVPGLEQILPLIRRLVGRPHHIAAHPGGIVVDRRALEDLLPLELAPKGVVVTQYDLVAIAKLGLVKIDLLGNRCLSELEETLTLAGTPQPLRLESIPSEDPATLALIDRAQTIGCFQLESPAMRSLLTRLPIRSQSDLTAALALIRPGAAAGEVKSLFIDRARGVAPDQQVFPVLADRLAETHGLFLYEEDVMALLSRTGGISLEQADELRRAIVKSGGNEQVLGELRSRYLEKARGGGAGSIPQARRAWETAARFAAYSFNKAHAASYALLAYFSAYTKAHHPLEFACALLNHHQGLYPLRVEAQELRRIGIKLLGPSANASQYRCCIEKPPGGKDGAAVRLGLDKIKGLSRKGASHILAERDDHGPFGTFKDLLERVPLNIREISALVLCGACDGLPPLHAVDYPFVHDAVLQRMREGSPLAELDRLKVVWNQAEDTERLRLYQGLTRIKNELRYLEMHLLAHPMALLRQEATRYGCFTIAQSLGATTGSRIRVAVVIAAMRRVPVREGVMQFFTLDDETGLLEGVLLPKLYRVMGERVTTPGPYLVEGRLRRQQEAAHLEVEKIAPFHERQHPFGR